MFPYRLCLVNYEVSNWNHVRTELIEWHAVLSSEAVVELRPEPLRQYVASVLSLERDEQYPEVILGLAKAAQQVGIDGLVDWITTGDNELSSGVLPAMEPYLTRVSEDTTGPIKSQLWTV